MRGIAGIGNSAFALAIAFSISPFPAFADEITYENARFGTTITFPLELFERRAELPANGDGALFFSDDGGSLAVWAGNNALDANPASTAAENRKRIGADFSITYERIGKDWLVQSGFEEGMIYYQRLEFGSDNVIHGFVMKWPESLRAKYDDRVSAIGNSLGPN
jgi:hypothetical protein